MKFFYFLSKILKFFRGHFLGVFLALGLGFRVRVINKQVYVGFISFKGEQERSPVSF